MFSLASVKHFEIIWKLQHKTKHLNVWAMFIHNYGYKNKNMLNWHQGKVRQKSAKLHGNRKKTCLNSPMEHQQHIKQSPTRGGKEGNISPRQTVTQKLNMIYPLFTLQFIKKNLSYNQYMIIILITSTLVNNVIIVLL